MLRRSVSPLLGLEQMWLQVVFFVLFNGVPSHTFSVKYGFIEQHVFVGKAI